MTTPATTTGGFAGDPAEAFTPPSAGGCCGSAPAAATGIGQAAATSPCCGTAAEAQEANSCCGSTAKTEAVASGAGCCG